eukprot:gene3023-3304_t
MRAAMVTPAGSWQLPTRVANPNVDGGELVNRLLHIVREVFLRLWGIDVRKQWILELDSSTLEKFSRHLVIRVPGHAFPDNAAVGTLVRTITSQIAQSAHFWDSSLSLPLPDASDSTVLMTLQQRPFAATTHLPADVAASITGKPKRVAVIRPAFIPYDVAQEPLSQVVAPLGPSAVALAAHTQLVPQRLLVDEYHRHGSSFTLATPATELATYLHRRALDIALSTNSVLMVAPTAFGFNEQAAQDNSFMHAAEKPHGQSSLTAAVCAEFAGLHRQLTDVAGVNVKLFQHHLSHGTPDAVFPNNWFSTHAAGEAAGGVGAKTLVLYPMKCPNRAAERRPEIVQFLQHQGYSRVVDMTGHEKHDQAYFEGTGVLVLDRVNGVAYVALSERADRGLAEQWVHALGYKDLVTFHSNDCRWDLRPGGGVWVTGRELLVIGCVLGSKLRATHEVVEISSGQMDALCGNVLELQGGLGLPVMAMSSQAYHAFTPDQRQVMRRHVADLVHAPIDTLEQVGGGGVRCSLAELF